MKKNLINMAVATTLGLAAFAASAEDMYRGAWYAVPGVSYMNTDSDLDAKNGPGVFLKLGKELSESWDIQGGLGYNRAKEDTGIAGVDGRYKQTTLGLDALYMFSRDSFRPFLLAGLGVARNNIDYTAPGITADGKKTSWLANVGLGAQYLINDSFGLQADLRHQWSRAKLDLVNEVNGATASESGRIGNTLLSLGGVFRFGAPAPVAMVEPTPEPVAPVAVAATEPEPAPAPLPAIPACNDKFETIEVSAEKLFGFDKSTLRDEGKTELSAAIENIKAHPALTLVLVTGHTDRIGSDAYNQKLSERRANQVRDYMIANGIDESRLQAVGKGESEPVVDCKGVKGSKALIECLATNRRVVISAEEKVVAGCK
jgi:OOP family OmpA-OmpF porin